MILSSSLTTYNTKIVLNRYFTIMIKMTNLKDVKNVPMHFNAVLNAFTVIPESHKNN